jgi:hypothetical protein
MKKISYTLLFLFISYRLSASENSGFDAHNLYTSNGALGSWSSFATNGASILVAGFAIRSVVILKLSLTGEGGNIVTALGKLLAAALGLYILQKLI